MRAEVDSVSSMRAVDRNLREAEDSLECRMHWAVEELRSAGCTVQWRSNSCRMKCRMHWSVEE